MKAPSLLPTILIAAWAVSSAFAMAGAPSRPIVSIEATVPVTTEPAPNIRVIPGEFTIRRKGGDLDEALVVSIQYSGTAKPGADYRALPAHVEFAPNQISLSFGLFAIDDDEVEEDETVIAQVFDPTDGPIPLFEVDPDHEKATITIHDSDRPPGPEQVVSIEATRRIAEETAAPLRRVNLVGEFTVSRSGSVLSPLPVWILVSGTATPREDYEALPLLIRIPEGEKSVSFPVSAHFDHEPEGIETVIATVSNCPPDGMLAPCYDFQVDESMESATVFIREDGLSVASLHLTSPSNGDHFVSGEPIPIRATAIHLESYISRVEFWADDELLEVSEIFFVRAPDPGTPIHHFFQWERAPAGEHVLTARASLPDRERLVSSPVNITVGEGGGNENPEVAIASPSAGDQFPAGDPIEIVIEARDPNGYIPQVELFADGLKIGEMNISFFVEPPPGLPQVFSFTWENPLPGDHVLTTRVTDNTGNSSDSARVLITVTPLDARPTVNVVARDALAVEPRPAGAPNPAIFRISRHGPDRGELVVLYDLGGQAENGVDYETLSGTAIIPSGSSWVDVTVVPLPDQDAEGSESVKLQLAENPAYLLERAHHAFAVIRDLPWPASGPLRCLRLSNRLIHICFPAPPGNCFRLEGSSDLRNWNTRFCLIPVDGNIHFVAEVIPDLPRRFFRIAPEPNRLPAE